ncbi:MAG: ATP-binding protein, partial [Chloroflexi bacterium]|nr:ATP-binding protein [Chloroflexota bacterium]
MAFIEAPTTFYMGRRFDPISRRLVDEVVYYDSRDLTTHAVVVGMTGSGKTGLCITLLEEAVMDGIPSIIIDPKGDITNLLLAFPNLQPADFEPWINVDDARRAGLEPPEFAADTAQKWRDGLASWGITSQRVGYFKQNARFSIYTPGSDAGLPISILDAMQAPLGGWQPGDDEFHRERISGIVTALLALIGRNVTPLKDREHVLISNIFEYAWRLGQDLTLEEVIMHVQKPPFAKLGVFDVDTFFSEKDRFSLAMELNNIIAAPSFQSWIQGEPLDIQSLLYTPEGKPRVSIFYIAHLNDAERMFVVTLLLENMISWMRTLSGTTSLRALLYFDEVFGFFPPHPYNPPSKEPIMRLLKQARAFGLGLVLATQNPGDLDYKGLANAGTWFIGKLQTENDKKKVLTGLETVASVDTDLNIQDIDSLLSTIDPRVFVMHNVHDRSGAIPIHTRWAMSFLRGPLTRQQIRTLMADQRQQPYYPNYQQPGSYGTPLLGTPRAATAAHAAPHIRAATPPPPESLPEMPPDLPEMSDSFGTPEMPMRPAPYATTPPPAAPVIGTQATQGITRSLPGRPNVSSTQATTGMTGRFRSDLPDGYSTTPPPVSSTLAQYFLPSIISMEQAAYAWQQQTGT